MKKNGWFFGDSFTSGFGLNFDHEINGINVSHNKFNAPLIDQIPNHLWDNIPYVKFKKYKEEYKFLIWPHLIAKHYDLEYNNYGVSGGSNDDTLFNIISQLKNINEGDYVFIGMTNPHRIMIPIDNPLDDKTLISTQVDWVQEGVSNKITNLENCNVEFYSDNDKEVIINFLHDIVLKNKHHYGSHFLKIFSNLQEYFIEKNINCLIWDWTLWADFQSIQKWTNNKIKDGHWSPKGHEDFFNFLKLKIEEKVKILNKEIEIINKEIEIINKEIKKEKKLI